MRRVRFRVLLPVLMLTLNLVFCVWSWRDGVQRAEAKKTFERQHERVSQERESVVVDFHPQDVPPETALKLAALFSFPAVCAGLFSMMFVHIDSVTAVIAFSTLFVPWLWFGIGRWIDRRLGSVPVVVTPLSRIRRVEALLLRTAAIFLLVVEIVEMTPLYHHATLDSYLMPSIVALWSGVYLACVVWERRTSRIN